MVFYLLVLELVELILFCPLKAGLLLRIFLNPGTRLLAYQSNIYLYEGAIQNWRNVIRLE